jgi:spermidine/putrescine-binding protein
MRRLLALLILLPLAACDRSAPQPVGRTLYLYIWSEYIPPSVLDEFTRRTGIAVHVDTYDSNETMLEKVQSGAARYDLVVPNDYMIRIMIEQKLLRPIDPAKLPGLANVSPRFQRRAFDPDNRHSVPYLWGTTGLGYNKQAIPGGVEGWAAVFDEKHKGRILMLDDMRECFAAALKFQGKSINAADESSLRAAADLLKTQKRLVKTYNSGDFDNVLASGDVDIAHGYNGQLSKLAARHPDKFAYVIPREGCTISQDALCIPHHAPNPGAAEEFMAYILEPQTAAAIVNGIHYPSTNEAAKPFIRAEILNNPAVYPPEELLKNAESLQDIGPATTLMDRLWTEIKAQ